MVSIMLDVGYAQWFCPVCEERRAIGEEEFDPDGWPTDLSPEEGCE